VKGAGLAGDAVGDDAGVFVNKDAHASFSHDGGQSPPYKTLERVEIITTGIETRKRGGRAGGIRCGLIDRLA